MNEHSETRVSPGVASRLLIAQIELLKAHAAGEDLESLFEMVVGLLEREIDGARGSVLLADVDAGTLSCACAPNLPQAYTNTIVNVAIGDFGTCSRAAFRQEQIIVTDATTDPAWALFQSIVIDFGFRASWSQPFFDPEHNLLGTLGLYFDDVREPTEEELAVLSVGAYLTGLFVTQDTAFRSLRMSEEKYRTLVENASDTLLLLNPDGTVAYTAPNIRRILGREPEALIGEHIGSIVAPDEVSRLDRAIATTNATGQGSVLEEIEAAHGSPSAWLRCALSVRGDQSGLVAIVSDVSRRRAVESQLQFAERMNTVGTLAAGVAHEINNPLAYVAGNLSYLRDILTDRLSSDDSMELLEALTDSIDGTKRVADIVSDLKSFTRERGRSHEPVNLAEVVRSSVRLTQPQIRNASNVDVQIDVSPLVLGDQTELGQIVVNLIVNAAQAIGDSGGTIVVGVRPGRGGEAVLTVSDDGPGMTEAVRERIFDPFFTTKGPDRGTGLGLAIVHGIVKRHGATIDVESKLGAGSTFSITFPVAHEAMQQEAKRLPSHGPLKILFVDDEEALGRSMARLLHEHEIHHAANGTVALDTLEVDQDWDMILLDLLMPEISGAKLFREITKRWPKLETRVSFMTGGTVSEESRKLVAQFPDRVLPKPFGRDEIAQLLEGLTR